MLFIQRTRLALSPVEGERLRLFDALAARGRVPLMRSARRRFFQMFVAQSAGSHEAAEELERECLTRPEREPYTPGDLFSAGDCLLFLVYDARAEGSATAGVVFDLKSAEPLAKLERFCRDVSEAQSEIKGDDEATQALAPPARAWQAQGRSLPQGLARFIAIQPAEHVRAAAARRGGRELARASELMEDRAVRRFLRRVEELRREGYTPRRVLAEAGAMGVSVERMIEAGLLEPEVRVSCRKSGHALFDLPSPDSLAAITISRAKCSLCAAPVADEVIEETINPTRLAVALLEDGGWLANRVYRLIRSLGIPESEIATGPASNHGESYLAADVCGNYFLFVTRDGDLTPAFCRRVVEIVEQTEATHLVVVVTGEVEEEGRLRLYEFAWRRARDGQDLMMTIVEGLEGARAQVERAFGAAVRRELSRNLFALDASLGFSASSFVLNWFKLAKDSAAKTHAPSVSAAAASESI